MDIKGRSYRLITVGVKWLIMEDTTDKNHSLFLFPIA